MNIALITEKTFPPVNRANLRLYRLAKVLVKKNHKVYFISPSIHPFSDTKFNYEGIKICQFKGFDKFLYSKLRAIVRGLHLFNSVAFIVSLNFKYQFDALHAWNPLAGLSAILAGKIIKKPVYIDFTDFYSDIAKSDSNKLVTNFFSKIENFILKNAEKIMVVSKPMKERLINQNIKESKIKIVEDGVDKNMFNPNLNGTKIRKKLGLRKNIPIIIYHGDIKPPDGVDILFKAFKVILREIPQTKLLIVGGGGTYFEKIKMLGKKLKIDKSIIYTGWIDHKEVPLYLVASDIGAMPMRPTLNHQCYLSFKLFEYWACGKPIITTKLKAISAIVKNGKNGLIVEPENYLHLAKAFIYLLKRPNLAKKLGKNGRKLIEEKFNWDQLMEKEVQFCYSSK